MRATLLALVAVLVVVMSASADVIELITGERIEGKSAKATDERVTVEVGGQTLSFDREKVRAIYLGSTQVMGTGTPALAREALQALKSLQSVAQAGVNYREYSPRVLDVKVKVDQYLQSPSSADAELRAAVSEAIAFYVLASSAWNSRITKNPFRTEQVGREPLIDRCPQLVQQIRKMGLGNDALSRGVVVEGSLPSLWACASDKIAEAERLQGQ